MKCEKCSMEATHRFIDSEGLVHLYCQHHAPARATKIGETPSSWKTYRPLVLILGLVVATTFITKLIIPSSTISDTMRWFMGYFFAVFGMTKVVTWKSFTLSFKKYDPIANIVPIYAWLYPALEITLAVLFLGGWFTNIASWVTLSVLGLTTLGILRSLAKGERLECACLGTWITLPLGWVTVLENTVMIAMAIWMLLI